VDEEGIPETIVLEGRVQKKMIKVLIKFESPQSKESLQ
jgi:hypothetical protein